MKKEIKATKISSTDHLMREIVSSYRLFLNDMAVEQERTGQDGSIIAEATLTSNYLAISPKQNIETPFEVKITLNEYSRVSIFVTNLNDKNSEYRIFHSQKIEKELDIETLYRGFICSGLYKIFWQ